MGYDSNNRLISYNGTAITYDADGNMISGVLGDTTAALTYNSKNQLISAGTTTYQYDVDGNRIRVTDANGQTTYVYDTTGSISCMLMSIDEAGNITKYVYGNGLIAQEDFNDTSR